MSEVPSIYDLKNPNKPTFIEFAKDELIKVQYDVFKFYPKLDNANFIECINSNFDLYSMLEYSYRFLLDSPKYNDIPEKCIEILNKKSYDYSSKDDRYSNFGISNNWAEKALNTINEETIDIVLDRKTSFLILLGTKVARLTELLTSDKTPNNESIEDSILDFMNYRLLLEGYMLGFQ